MQQPDDLYSMAQAARCLKVDPSTLWRWMHLPMPIKVIPLQGPDHRRHYLTTMQLEYIAHQHKRLVVEVDENRVLDLEERVLKLERRFIRVHERMLRLEKSLSAIDSNFSHLKR